MKGSTLIEYAAYCLVMVSFVSEFYVSTQSIKKALVFTNNFSIDLLN